MESYIIPDFPPYATRIHIALFRNISNAPEIRKRLISASTMEGVEGDQARDAVDFGFVDASLVCVTFHGRCQARLSTRTATTIKVCTFISGEI